MLKGVAKGFRMQPKFQVLKLYSRYSHYYSRSRLETKFQACSTASGLVVDVVEVLIIEAVLPKVLAVLVLVVVVQWRRLGIILLGYIQYQANQKDNTQPTPLGPIIFLFWGRRHFWTLTSDLIQILKVLLSFSTCLPPT